MIQLTPNVKPSPTIDQWTPRVVYQHGSTTRHESGGISMAPPSFLELVMAPVLNGDPFSSHLAIWSPDLVMSSLLWRWSSCQRSTLPDMVSPCVTQPSSRELYMIEIVFLLRLGEIVCWERFRFAPFMEFKSSLNQGLLNDKDPGYC